MPNLMGPVCAQPGRSMTAGAAAAAPTVAAVFRNVLRVTSFIRLSPCAIALDLEVLPSHVVVAGQLSRAATKDDLALGHHVHALGERQRRLDGLLHEQDRRPAAVN